MYARVWKFVILPGKIAEFTSAANAIMPMLREQPGFRGCLMVRGGPEEMLEATVISVWESLVHLRNSETNAFQKGLSLILNVVEHHPSLREEEVVISEFPTLDLSDTVTDF